MMAGLFAELFIRQNHSGSSSIVFDTQIGEFRTYRPKRQQDQEAPEELEIAQESESDTVSEANPKPVAAS